MNPASLKGPCDHCGTNLEFPAEMEGQTIQCPNCQQATLLATASIENPAATQTHISAPELMAMFPGPVPRTRVSLFYQLGLCVVAFTMVLLPLFYIALVGLAACAVFLWATGGLFLFSDNAGGGRVFL